MADTLPGVNFPGTERESEDDPAAVRLLLLTLRRSRVPWVYLLYHRHEEGRGATRPPPLRSALAAEERRDVQRGRHISDAELG